MIQSWALLPWMIQSGVASPCVPWKLLSRALGGVGILVLVLCFSLARVFFSWALARVCCVVARPLRFFRVFLLFFGGAGVRLLDPCLLLARVLGVCPLFLPILSWAFLAPLWLPPSLVGGAWRVPVGPASFGCLCGGGPASLPFRRGVCVPPHPSFFRCLRRFSATLLVVCVPCELFGTIGTFLPYKDHATPLYCW